MFFSCFFPALQSILSRRLIDLSFFFTLETNHFETLTNMCFYFIHLEFWRIFQVFSRIQLNF